MSRFLSMIQFMPCLFVQFKFCVCFLCSSKAFLVLSSFTSECYSWNVDQRANLDAYTRPCILVFDCMHDQFMIWTGTLDDILLNNSYSIEQTSNCNKRLYKIFIRVCCLPFVIFIRLKFESEFWCNNRHVHSFISQNLRLERVNRSTTMIAKRNNDYRMHGHIVDMNMRYYFNVTSIYQAMSKEIKSERKTTNFEIWKKKPTTTTCPRGNAKFRAFTFTLVNIKYFFEFFLCFFFSLLLAVKQSQHGRCLWLDVYLLSCNVDNVCCHIHWTYAFQS